MRFFYAFFFAAVTLVSCSKFTKVQKSTDVNYKLRMAEQYYAKKKYNQAQTLFEELFPIVKGTPQFEDLYYKYAYCAYYQRDYANAENLFKGFAEVFPNSPRTEATNPTAADSPSDAVRTCPREAPTARSSADSRERWATMIEKVL